MEMLPEAANFGNYLAGNADYLRVLSENSSFLFIKSAILSGFVGYIGFDYWIRKKPDAEIMETIQNFFGEDLSDKL